MAYSYFYMPFLEAWVICLKPQLGRVERQLRTSPPQICPQPGAILMDVEHSYALDAPSEKEQQEAQRCCVLFREVLCPSG